MSRVFDIADQYIDKVAALDPVAATAFGVPGHDHEMPDYSPDGVQAEADLDKATLSELGAAPVGDERDRVACEMMIESLRLQQDRFDAREHLRGLSILHSPIHSTRMVFDFMPRESEEHWRNIAARMALVPTTLESYQRTLGEGLRQGMVASRRQASETADQCDVWSGKIAGQPSFFQGLLDAYDQSDVSSEPLRRELANGMASANNAMAATARYLRETYVPGSAERDAVGADRYALSARVYNGVDLDLRQTYAWGWEQLAWVEEEMAATAERILPGGGVAAAKELLETDPARAVDGENEFRQWMQDLQDHTIAELNGVHFDIAEPVKRIEALIAPPGGALAMYYTPPSEDFSRPGRTWYPTGGKTRFPLWGEVSIAYHEGVPGHHFQLATTNHLSTELSRFQRLMGGSSGYVEGWGLYAERLMAELGYLENPDYYLGMLRAQALRSVRVILDIGMHLELAIPTGQSFHPGETWTPDLGLEFINLKSHFPPDFVASEISRYLGLPGQAISYKVGERAWLDARAAAKERQGAAFDLKEFHTRALDLGPMGLAQMQRELARV
ncbi:MAG: DUF885 domain-containing protein [SAR202 cluster bacterium]|nr:DUF885 domain-containing protein [Chloroflexota bacterium]MDP6798784.1 DUF885 domain-containing protein [SAR202 cluster bacterium]MQG57958.1 DUF885 domain-containing protein [SAR202 cluster bacterium]MQG69757.1 DUF885 domain-containing protein [SAR202 cluster bacterium]